MKCWGSAEVKSALCARCKPRYIVHHNHFEQPIILCGDPNPILNSLSYALQIKANSTQRAKIFFHNLAGILMWSCCAFIMPYHLLCMFSSDWPHGCIIVGGTMWDSKKLFSCRSLDQEHPWKMVLLTLTLSCCCVGPQVRGPENSKWICSAGKREHGWKLATWQLLSPGT